MAEIESRGAEGHLAGWRAAMSQALENYRRMLAYVQPYWPQLALAGASLVAISLLNLALPWAVQQVVDLVVGDEGFGRLNRIALLLAGLFFLRAVLGLVQTYLVSWVGERVVLRLRQQIYDHVLSLSLGFFNRQRVGELVSRMTNDVQVIQAAVTSNIVMLLQQIVTTTGILVVVATMNLQLSLLLAVAIPGMVLVTRLLGRRMRHIARQVQDMLAQAASVFEETVGGIRIVKSFAREAYESDRFGQELEGLFAAAMRRTRIYAGLGPLISLLLYGSMSLVLWVGGRQVLMGRLTPGQLIAFLFYAFMLTGPLSNFATIYSQVQAALGATERIFELLDTRPEIVPAPDAHPLPPIVGHVVLDGVSFDYDPRQPVLRHVTLEARPGEVVALVGPSGVGKTTLVNLIPRFYDPTSGAITIDGQDVRRVTLRSLRDQIGVVPQETLLFSDTVAANIRYGRLDASQAEIVAAARAANAHQFIVDELPDGYETQVGERGAKLSGGQRQRIAIARAILKDPRILILDEATSSLDTESEKLVQEALDRLMHPDREIAGGRTTFIIAHRLSTITGADRIVVLDGGRVVEQGSHEELLAREDGLYRHYHALQFRWDTTSPVEDAGQEQPPAPPPAEAWTDFLDIFPPSDEPRG
ncbi:MAG: ABC transporter ATP-binding protein [Anaerolineae bacterium]|jgi:subfamily B ATP-binding cassette protein MsbA